MPFAAFAAWRQLRRRQTLRRRVLEDVGLQPAQTLVVGFLALIAAGTFLLWLPASAVAEGNVPLVDAFFTAVSATCVTGLATVDTATAWTPFGQGVILALVQLGALGIMVIAGAMSLAVGGTLGAEQGADLEDLLDAIGAQPLHERPVVGGRRDPAFGLQCTQRFAHRHAGNAEMLGQRHLIELGTVRQRAVANGLAQRIGDPVGDAVALLERAIGRNSPKIWPRHRHCSTCGIAQK